MREDVALPSAVREAEQAFVKIFGEADNRLDRTARVLDDNLIGDRARIKALDGQLERVVRLGHDLVTAGFPIERARVDDDLVLAQRCRDRGPLHGPVTERGRRLDCDALFSFQLHAVHLRSHFVLAAHFMYRLDPPGVVEQPAASGGLAGTLTSQ